MKLIDIVRQGALEKMSNSKIRHFIELSKLSDAKLLYCLSFQETTAAEAQSPLEPKSQSSHNQPEQEAEQQPETCHPPNVFRKPPLLFRNF
ncbi:MAG: hypothetical protein JRI89_13620 [Deltaproteobacteria bacterium]|nr:hypothetical protein [Deltaproteobacteria bacterium]